MIKKKFKAKILFSTKYDKKRKKGEKVQKV